MLKIQINKKRKFNETDMDNASLCQAPQKKQKLNYNPFKPFKEIPIFRFQFLSKNLFQPIPIQPFTENPEYNVLQNIFIWQIISPYTAEPIQTIPFEAEPMQIEKPKHWLPCNDVSGTNLEIAILNDPKNMDMILRIEKNYYYKLKIYRYKKFELELISKPKLHGFSNDLECVEIINYNIKKKQKLIAFQCFDITVIFQNNKLLIYKDTGFFVKYDWKKRDEWIDEYEMREQWIDSINSCW